MRRSASEILRSLEMRIARLEKQSASKQQAYDALRSFVNTQRRNPSVLISLSGYLQMLKEGKDLSERDLKEIRKVLHRNNAFGDLISLFKTNPTSTRPTSTRPTSTRPTSKKPKPKPKPKKPTFPISLEKYAKVILKQVRKHFGPRMITMPKSKWGIEEIYVDYWLPKKKCFVIPIFVKGKPEPLLKVIAPMDGDYRRGKMPPISFFFWEGKTWGKSVDEFVEHAKRTLNLEEPKKTTPKSLSIKEIIRFLENEASTDIGGGFHSLRMYRGSASYWEFQMEPGDRQRQDHWHFSMPNYDHEEDNRDEAWSDWEYNWAYPLQEETEQALKVKFPVLADNRQWGVMVGEKGHIDFQFPKDLISEN